MEKYTQQARPANLSPELKDAASLEAVLGEDQNSSLVPRYSLEASALLHAFDAVRKTPRQADAGPEVVADVVATAETLE